MLPKKNEKWNAGLRLDTRILTDLNTFYADPKNRLSVMTRSHLVYNNNGTMTNSELIEVLTFGDVKNIQWSPRLNATFSYNIKPRISLDASLGLSYLQFDVDTRELKGRVLYDSLGVSSWLYTPGAPQTRSAGFRKGFLFIDPIIGVSGKIIKKEDFDLKLFAGAGITSMIHWYQGLENKPKGINDMKIFNTFEENYWYLFDQRDIYAYQGDLEIDLTDSPDKVLSKFGNDDMATSWKSPENIRFMYPFFRVGAQADVDRFNIGFSYEQPLTYMDGFMLKNYRSLNMSIGYKIWTR